MEKAKWSEISACARSRSEVQRWGCRIRNSFSAQCPGPLHRIEAMGASCDDYRVKKSTGLPFSLLHPESDTWRDNDEYRAPRKIDTCKGAILQRCFIKGPKTSTCPHWSIPKPSRSSRTPVIASFVAYRHSLAHHRTPVKTLLSSLKHTNNACQVIASHSPHHKRCTLDPANTIWPKSKLAVGVSDLGS